MCCRQLIVAVAVGSVDVLQAASTSALKSVQNVNSMHAVVAERLRLVTLSVHVCYRDDVQLQETSETGKECIKQIRDVCELRVYPVTADSAGTFRCVASNVAGSAQCKAQVTVVGKLVAEQQH